MTRATQMSDGLQAEIEALRQLGEVEQPTEEARQRMLESIFLNGATEFESFLEDVFLAAVSRQIRPGSTKVVVPFPDPDMARSLLMRPGDSYLTWMPIRHSLERANQFLEGGTPFSRIESRPQVRERLELATAVRNAIAHKSVNARRRFEEQTSGKYRSPGQYLAAKLGEGTVCDSFLRDFVRYGHSLCVSDAEARALLGPEGPFGAGAKVGPGVYQCAGCSAEYSLPRREALVCRRCDPLCSECGKAPKTAQFTRVD